MDNIPYEGRHLSRPKWETCFTPTEVIDISPQRLKWTIFLVTESLRADADDICDGSFQGRNGRHHSKSGRCLFLSVFQCWNGQIYFVTEPPSAQVDYTCDGSFQRQNLSRHLSTKKWATCFKDWTMSFSIYLSARKWAIFLVTKSLRPEVDHICDGIILKRIEWTTSSSFYWGLQ